ncbi:MAG: glycosyltransferase [Propionibacteriales bacterium]|nr:glycosyltransferase [Propionibacteriales bacterium]
MDEVAIGDRMTAAAAHGRDEVESVPLVSVVMATYNCEDTLAEALESIETQSYPRWELVVCDDASTDGSPALLDEFASRHAGKVVVLRNEVNSKLAHSLNRCLAVAQGEYVARMDGDDVSLPHRFERQAAYLEDHPEVSLVGTAIQRFDRSGPKDVLVLAERPDRTSLRHGVPFAHATVMVRAAAYADLGGYTVSPRTERGQDYDLWFRFFHREMVGHNLPEPLYLVREDEAAIRRRTLRVRWRSYQTILVGFRLLGFPLHWYLAPTLALGKGLVPYRLIGAYRQWQHTVFARAASRRTPGTE